MFSNGLRKTSVRKDLRLIHERLKMGSNTAKAYSSSKLYLPWSVTIASIILFHVSTQVNWWIQMLLKKKHIRCNFFVIIQNNVKCMGIFPSRPLTCLYVRCIEWATRRVLSGQRAVYRVGRAPCIEWAGLTV